MGICVRAGHKVQNFGQRTFEATSLVVESTEASKKALQIIKGFLDLTGLFTNVGSFSPIVNFAKGAITVINGTDIVGRIKDWVLPDKNGQTLANKHWTKIISRIWLTFANIIDFYNMLKFFNIFKLLKLSQVAQNLGRMALFRGVFDIFAGLEAIKNVFVLFSASWSILDSAITIDRKHQYLKHVKFKENEWKLLSEKSLAEQSIFFERKSKKYDAISSQYRGMRAEERKKALRKLSRAKRNKIEKSEINAPKYHKLSESLKSGQLDAKGETKLNKFFTGKLSKWHTKITVVKVDFSKSAVSIACDVAKIFVVSMSIILFLTGVGSTVALPAVLIGLGLISNGLSLFKFLFDKMMIPPSPKRTPIPKIVPAM